MKILLQQKKITHPYNLEKHARAAATGRIKHIKSRVVASAYFLQYNKPKSVFSFNRKLSVKGRKQLENLIFSCGMVLESTNLYPVSHLISTYRGCKELLVDKYKELKNMRSFTQFSSHVQTTETKLLSSVKLTKICYGSIKTTP